MRNLKAVFFVALAACGGGSDTPTPVDTAPADTAPPVDDPPPPDSQVLDLSCAANQTPPTTATATVTISGQASSVDFNFSTFMIDTDPADEADIDACINDCVGNNNILDSTTSDMLATCGADSCAFTTVAIDTPGDAPIDAYLKVSKTGLRTTNIAPSEPVRADLASVPAVMLTPTAFGGAATLAQVQQNDTDNGAMIVAVTDCALNPVLGATLIVTQKGAPVGTVFNGGDIAAEAGGGFIVFNVPEGETTVGAMVNGTTLRAHVVQVFAGETTATQVTPGFAAP